MKSSFQALALLAVSLLFGVQAVPQGTSTRAAPPTSASLSANPSSTAISPPRTNLSLPLPAGQCDSRCCNSSQEYRGPTLLPDGRGLYYLGENETFVGNLSQLVGPGVKLANGSSCCDSLTQVRDYLDYIDSQIVHYLSLRQQFVTEATRFKTSEADVRVPPRGVQVVKQAIGNAQKDGLSEWIANVTFTSVLNLFTEYEICLFDEYKSNATLRSNATV